MRRRMREVKWAYTRVVALTRTVLVGSICLAVLTSVVGCGSGNRGSTIPTDAARPTSISVSAAAAALRQAGFPTWVGRRTLSDERMGEIYTVEVTRAGYGLDWPAAELTHFKTSALAAMDMQQYSPAALRRLERIWRKYPAIAKTGQRSCGVGCLVGGRTRPRGFAIRKVSAYRVCNVVLSSYNAHLDPRLTARVRHAVRLLRATCPGSGQT